MSTKGVLQEALLVAVIALGIFCFSAGTGLAQVLPKGDVCWTVKKTQDENGTASGSYLMKLHLVRSSDGTQITASGVVSPPDDNSVFLTGIGSMVGTKIYMNLTDTQFHKDTWRDTGVVQAQLNATTLNGTFFEIGHDFKTDATDRKFDQRFSAGKLTRTKCP
jgi:hypothetical protein